MATPGVVVGDILDRPTARRTLAVVVRLGALLLASGAGTEEVERAMGTVARASGLTDVQAIVQFGTISVSYDPALEQEPMTVIRVARHQTTDFARLAAASALERRLIESRMTVNEALHELDRIERSAPTYSHMVSWFAGTVAAGSSTVLFGGGPIDVGVAMLATTAVNPVLGVLTRSGLPQFFQNVLGPAIATLLAMLLVVAGVPANGPLVVTGAILIFLPGGALAAGMRDLIDGSIVSGTARLFEAFMLGAAVAIGVSIGLSIAAYWGAPTEFALPDMPGWSLATVAAAAGIACAAFAVSSQVPTDHLWSIAVVGAIGLVVQRALLAAGTTDSLAAAAAAAVIGALARELAQRHRTSASIWVGAAILPLVPGRQLVEGLIETQDGAGGADLVAAVLVGFGIGIGVALGDTLVSTLRRLNQTIVAPGVVNPVAGLVEDRLSWVTRRGGGNKPSARP